MSALATNIGLSSDSTSVTKISAHARIDYILRFSKQAILVIDESDEQNAPISGQFLASLPEQHNAAYISLSAQFNNIQIRCRIIEQLYTGELFDPEISLAVSVINLAKKSQQAISIVFDNTQHLSLQLLHEVTQLAAIAKKSNLVVNIVMFGSTRAGKIVAENKSLFDDKLALLSAQSGQLLSTSAAMFKDAEPKWHFIKQNKWLLGLLFFLVAVASLVIGLLQQDSFKFSQVLMTTTQEEMSLSQALAKPQTMALKRSKEEPAAGEKPVEVSAAPADIYSSLIHPSSEPTIKVQLLPASPEDIMMAMAEAGTENIADIINITTEPVDAYKVKNIAKHNSLITPLMVNNDYYLARSGYIIQIAAFSELKLPALFIDTLKGVEYQVYQRLLNDKPLIVITSIIYANKDAAELALSQLPESLLNRQPWIKSLEIVNNEINMFLSSQ
jgi:DamX protein